VDSGHRSFSRERLPGDDGHPHGAAALSVLPLPADVADHLNYAVMARIVRGLADVVATLAND
jgi:hypothetical protein